MLSLDLIKALAAQLVFWHHAILYGPVADSAWRAWPGLTDWLLDDAKMAVQVFLVVAGFLAIQSLDKRFPPAAHPRVAEMFTLAWQRYRRLAPAYLLTCAVVLVTGIFVREVLRQPTADEVSAGQVVANVLMLQDIIGFDGLSAGLWYVAIDLQLYVLLLSLYFLARSLCRGHAEGRAVFLALVLVMSALSLLVFNRDADLEAWAVYFFFTYGCGVLAYCVSRSGRSGLRALAVVCVGATVAWALQDEWRPRVVVSMVTFMVLCEIGSIEPVLRRLCGGVWAALAQWLAQSSYHFFLIHYTVLLLGFGIVSAGWPGSPGANTLGFGLAWLGSMALAGGMLHVIEPWLTRPLQRRGPGRSEFR